jgi:hypothetical protein
MRRLLPALGLALAAACSTEPALPLGRDYYALESVAGVALPAPYAPNPSYNGLLVADSIMFREDGTGHRQAVYQEENSTTRFNSSEALNWTRSGNRIEVTFVCPPTASCIAGPHLVGTLDGTTITMTESVVMRHPLVYRRSGVERLE